MNPTIELEEQTGADWPTAAVARTPAVGIAPHRVEVIPPIPMPEPSTAVRGFPESATFSPWTLTPGNGGVMPVRRPEIHIANLIDPNETVLLVSIHDLSDWVGIRRALTPAKELGIETLMLGSGTPNFLSSAVVGGGILSARHGRTRWPCDRAIFVPNNGLARVLGLQHSRHVKNGIVLIHGGRVVATWTAPSGTEGHNWTNIHAALAHIHEDASTEELMLDS